MTAKRSRQRGARGKNTAHPHRRLVAPRTAAHLQPKKCAAGLDRTVLLRYYLFSNTKYLQFRKEKAAAA